MCGTMVSFSTLGNDEKEYKWVAAKSINPILKNIKKQNNQEIIIYEIKRNITYEDFIKFIEKLYTKQ